jgi:SET domain-containing protein
MNNDFQYLTEKKSTETIEAQEADYLYIDVSQLKGAGNGLFTAVPIYKEEIISLFKGEILTERQIQIRLNKDQDKYFIEMLDGSIMDSMHVKCFAKYANDATGFVKSVFKNNCKIAFDENEQLCLIATRNIKANEEIFCSYGKRYWKKHGMLN